MSGDLYCFSPASLDDVGELAVMEKLLFHTDQCSRKSFRHLIKRGEVLLAKRPGEKAIAGYAIVLARSNSHKMRIYSLGVMPGERNGGLGRQLVAKIEESARATGRTMLTLEVDAQNAAAIALYRKCGFHQYGFRPGYYQDGGHALLLHKSLTTPANHDHPLDTGKLYQ